MSIWFETYISFKTSFISFVLYWRWVNIRKKVS